MSDEQTARRSKQAKTAAGVGAIAIAAALAKMLAGEPIDCTVREKCRRHVEAARAEELCGAKLSADPVKHLECIVDVTEGWKDTAKECPALNFKVDCAPFVKEFPLDLEKPLPAAKKKP